MHPSRQTVGIARNYVISWVKQNPLGVSAAIRQLNGKLKNRTLPKRLAESIRLAREKPRSNIELNQKTYYQWLRNLKERGSLMPLRRVKDTAVKPWHEMAWLLKQRNPTLKNTAILAKLNGQHPDVSYWQLLRFVHALEAEGAL